MSIGDGDWPISTQPAPPQFVPGPLFVRELDRSPALPVGANPTSLSQCLGTPTLYTLFCAVNMGTIAMEIYGPSFVGLLLNVALWGIMVTQTYMYFNVYRRDRRWLKFLVLFLFLCDTINCGFDIAFVYEALVNNFGDDKAIARASWLFATDPFMTAFIGAAVQLFFAWRVKVLTGNTLAVVAIVFCSLAQLCGGLGSTIAIGIIQEFEQFQRGQVIVIVWLAFSAVADTLITTSLVWHLRKHKTGMPVTDGIVDRIIRLTVQTGLITSLCAIIDLILFLVSTSGLHLLFNFPLSKLYTNSLMSSLNSRTGWQYDSSGISANRPDQKEQQSHIARNNRQRSAAVNMLRSDNGRLGPQEIYIDVESHEMVDVVDVKNHSYIPDHKAGPIGSHDMAQTSGSESDQIV